MSRHIEPILRLRVRLARDDALLNRVLRIIALVGFAVVAVPTTAVESENGEIIVPGDNLVVEGIPEIPADLADAMRPYTEFRGASICSWHPVRREMLISTQLANTSQLHEVKFPGGARTQLTFFKEPYLRRAISRLRVTTLCFRATVAEMRTYQKYPLRHRVEGKSQRVTSR